jgi:DNA-binding NarL/FixJ family response regulator
MIEQQTRILVVEDHRILREGLRAILDAQADFLVVGEAEDGREAINRARELRPDVVLLDISMPRMNGLEAIQDLKRVAPGARVVILTVHGDHEYVEGALRAGADGFLTKDSSGEELATGVRRVARGSRYLCRAVADFQAVAEASGQAPPETPGGGSTLSRREREVLKLVAEGYRSREIAAYLCISIKTVEKHRSSLMHKIGVTNVSGLTAYAIERDLVCPLPRHGQGPARLDPRPGTATGADAQLATGEGGALAHGTQAQAQAPRHHPLGVGGRADAVITDP